MKIRNDLMLLGSLAVAPVFVMAGGKAAPLVPALGPRPELAAADFRPAAVQPPASAAPSASAQILEGVGARISATKGPQALDEAFEGSSAKSRPELGVLSAMSAGTHAPGYQYAAAEVVEIKADSPFAFNKAGTRIVAASQPDELTLYLAWNGERLAGAKFPGSVAAVSWSPNGNKLAVGSLVGKDMTGKVWGEVAVLDVLLRRKVSFVAPGGPSKLAWSPDGAKIAVTSDEGTTIADLASGRASKPIAGARRFLEGFWSRDGNYFVTADDQGFVASWHAESGMKSQVIQAVSYAKNIWFSAVSPDKSRLAFVDLEGTERHPTSLIAVRDMAAGRTKYIATDGHFENPVFSPDGTKIMAASSGSETLRVWKTSSGDGWINFARKVVKSAFSADERKIVMAEADGLIAVWDETRGYNIHAPGEAATSPIDQVEISQDGNRVALGYGADRTIKVWSLRY